MSKLLELLKKDKLTKADIAELDIYEEKKWTYEEAVQWLTDYNLIAEFFEDRSWQFVFKQMSDDQYDKLERTLTDYSGNGITIEYMIENDTIIVVCVRFVTESIKLLDKELAFEPMIKDESQHLLFGWAYVAKDKEGNQAIDHSGEFIKEENFSDLEAATYLFNIAYRDADIRHDCIAKGQLVESIVMTKEKQEAMGIPEGVVPLGVWMGYFFEKDEDWNEISKMKNPMYSLYGSAVKEEVEE